MREIIDKPIYPFALQNALSREGKGKPQTWMKFSQKIQQGIFVKLYIEILKVSNKKMNKESPEVWI